jgi:hypothetical protein
MKVAVEHIFNGPTSVLSNDTDETYDPNVTMLGSLFRQYTGANSIDKYISSDSSVMVNIPETTAGTPFHMPHVVKRTEDIYWIFTAPFAAAATRNVALFEYDTRESSVTYKGFITIPGTTIAGNKTARALRGFVYTHSTGTVSTNGSSTTLVGSGTGFQSERIAAGARIGFGSTDPFQITEWYEISSITNDTTLILDREANISNETPYVIEEIRVLLACSNATLNNGGPHLVKGLNYNTFAVNGVTIIDNPTTDNIRASYLLVDDITTTSMRTTNGLASDEQESNTEHIVYLLNLDTTTTVTCHKLNIRAALSVSTGRSADAWQFKTGSQTITGTVSILNNGRLFSVNHLSATGEKSVWFASTTRIFRAAVSNITPNNASWISDFMTEVPVGSTTTHNITNTMNQVDYSSSVDRLIVPTGAQRFGIYVGQYTTGNDIPFEYMVGGFQNRVKLSTTPSTFPNFPFQAAICTVWTESGYMFIIPSVTTTGLNWLYIFPFSIEGYYSNVTNQRIITPKLSTPNAKRLYRVYVNHEKSIGGPTERFPTDSFNVYYRTNGIDDNTGNWTVLPENGDMTGVAPGSAIQFMLELNILKTYNPTKIYSVCCIYEDNSQDIRYQPSLTKSSAANNRFAWKQVLPWGGNIPNLQLQLYNAANEFLVLDDDTENSLYGTWEYSDDDGNTWKSWNSSADSIGNFIRYTATTLPNNITVRVLLSQA